MNGIVVGCDANQEWLLEWWWKHYSLHNNYPVAFVDFGMSERSAAWCRERGVFVSLPPVFSPLKPVAPEKKEQWEFRAGDGIWPFRTAWFKKPLAFLHSPFPTACWIDLDCEIRGSLAPLFDSLEGGADLAIVREPESVQENDFAQNLILPGEVTYNSGVVVFRRGAPLFSLWANISLEQNCEFMGDQNALSRLIYLHEPPLVELPSIYNWKKDLGLNLEAVILHYVCGHKLEILKMVHPTLFV
jgi:hypothetical protein